MPLTFTETPLYYKDSQSNYHRILSGADMTGYRTAVAQDVIDAGLVSAAAAQSFSDAQQAQARNNIGAIDSGSIATIESSPATQAHAVGDYIVYNGQLYKVTAAISQGESLTSGTNVIAAFLADEFSKTMVSTTQHYGTYSYVQIVKKGKIVLLFILYSAKDGTINKWTDTVLAQLPADCRPPINVTTRAVTDRASSEGTVFQVGPNGNVKLTTRTNPISDNSDYLSGTLIFPTL